MKCILVVDDCLEMRETLAHILVYNVPNCLIFQASSGNQAMSLISQDHFDLIVSDYEMQDGNGYDLLKFVNESRPDIDFLLYTSQILPKLPSNLSKNFLGTCDKPDFEELLKTIRKSLEK